MIKLPHRAVQLGAILSLSLALALHSAPPAPISILTPSSSARPVTYSSIIRYPPHAALLQTLQSVCLDRKQTDLIRKLALICITNISYLENHQSAAPHIPGGSTSHAPAHNAMHSHALLTHCPQVLSQLLDLYSSGDKEVRRVVSILLSNLVSSPGAAPLTHPPVPRRSVQSRPTPRSSMVAAVSSGGIGAAPPLAVTATTEDSPSSESSSDSDSDDGDSRPSRQSIASNPYLSFMARQLVPD